ncbi:MAG: tripartite tricarboxylate transporter substrate-binding protein, partial [Burkholderiaceae bacterium]
MGQPFVIENRPGAGGSIGAAVVAKSVSDGYTLFLGNGSSHGVTPGLYARLPYDSVNDFSPVALIATAANVLVVGSDVPVASYADFARLAREQPGRMTIASAGNGSLSHLSVELLRSMARLDLLHVPYKGAAPGVADVAGGQVQAMIINIPSVMPLIKAGKLKALAATSAKRPTSLPEVPTLEESGVKGYETLAWFGLLAPANTPLEINTVSINDGITTGTEGMKTSLISRELIADSVELVARGHMLDALVVIAGCDKTIPAMAMALGRLNLPGLLLYSGSIASGACTQPNRLFGDRRLTIQELYEAIGAFNAGHINEQEFKDVEDHACPGAGACGGQFTANTMATACEMMGLSPLGLNGIPALDNGKSASAQACGQLVMNLLRGGVTPRALVNRRSFENAITGVMATGGSTNAVLHLLAMAREFEVALSIDDFDPISRRTPVLADMRPWGQFTAPELHAAGGMPVVGKRLLEAGLLHAQERTVTGRTLGEEIQLAAEPAGQQVIRPLANPLKA